MPLFSYYPALWHDTIRAEEAAQRRVVVAGVVIEQAGAVLALPGVVQRGRRGRTYQQHP